MELNRENMKKIRELILFTAIVIVCLWKFNMVLQVLLKGLNIFIPFLLGGAIAFVLNVPMNFVERHLFSEDKRKGKRYMQKAARPCSMILLVPQLGNTFSNLGKNVQIFLPHVQAWAKQVFHNNKEIMNIVNNIEFDWDKIMNAGIGFFKNGAGSVLDSTITAAKSIVSGVTTFFIAFVFAIYILLQKEKLEIQAKKVLFAFVRKGRAEAIIEVCSLTYKTFSSFLTGQCLEAVILGSMFVVAMTIFRLPYALLIGIVIAFTALIPIFGAFVGCGIGVLLIFMVNPAKAAIFIVLFLVLQQIEGNLIYPHVVGNSVGLPSIWVLAAVSVGGSLMGITGMLIFIPIVSVLYALFREVVYLKLKKNKIDPGKIR